MGSRETLRPRHQPCPSCPYRRDVPSGIWAADEYDKLPQYDGSTTDQVYAGTFSVFLCHNQNSYLCAGWVGCHDMPNNLALRMYPGDVDYDAVFDYVSPVPLFASGAEAAQHGKNDIEAPGPTAQRHIGKLLRRRSARDGSGAVT